MEIQLATAIIGAASALLGSLAGGVASYLSTRSMRKLEWKLLQVEKEIQRRETLYADFLSDANKFIVQSFEQKVNSINDLGSIINYESKIRLVSPSLGSLAREITACVLDYHQKDKKTEREYPKLRDEFIEKCRAELDILRSSNS